MHRVLVFLVVLCQALPLMISGIRPVLDLYLLVTKLCILELRSLLLALLLLALIRYRFLPEALRHFPHVTYAPDQTTVFSAPNIVPVLGIDGTVISNYTKDSVIFRPELGATVVSKHRTNDYKNIPTADVPYGTIANKSITTAPSTNINAFCTPGIGNNLAGLIWYDNDWTGHNITVRGVGAGNTFRVETSYCFEINPSNVSNLYPFTVKQSPKLNSAILTRAQTLTGSLPAATPYLGEH